MRPASITSSSAEDGAHPAAAQNPPRHVVLVHGIWDTARTLHKMERALAKAGFQPLVVTLSPNSGRAKLDVLAAQVREQIEGAISPDERLSLVAFSMGGLVARSYLRQFGQPKRIAAFVSIASPHRGTLLAWALGLPGVRDMRPGSAFLAAIDADAARYDIMRWVTIRTPLDLMILPSTSSMLPWAENHTLPVLAHPLLVLDSRVIDLVIRSLSGPESKSSPAQPASPR